MYISLIHTAAAALLSTVISISSHACPRGPISGRGIEARNYTAPPDKKIAITNVKVFDGQRILPPTTVVIDGGKIGLVGMSDSSVDETIDGESGVLLPGLFDSHNHPESLDDLQRLTSYGKFACSFEIYHYTSCQYQSESRAARARLKARKPANRIEADLFLPATLITITAIVQTHANDEEQVSQLHSA